MATQLMADKTMAELIASLGGTPDQRRQAKRELLALGNQSVSPLIKMVRSGEGHRSWAAAELLGELGDAKALPALVEALRSDNPILGSAAARSLAQFPDWNPSRYLTEALPDADIITQQNIVLSLLQLGEPDSAASLIEQLSGGTPAALLCVILQAVGELGDPAAIPAVQKLVKHEDHHVRQWAETALEQLSDGRPITPPNS